MTDHVFKWTEFALGHGTRLLAILLIAFVLNRLLRGLTRRLIRAAETESPVDLGCGILREARLTSARKLRKRA